MSAFNEPLLMETGSIDIPRSELELQRDMKAVQQDLSLKIVKFTYKM